MTPAGRTRFASLMLLLATAAWALSFSLGKDAGARMNELVGAPAGTFFGPTALQGSRFMLAAIIWFAICPAARRGWTRLSLWRGFYSGLFLASGIILQHLALDLISPARVAFLTSLTVLWVPAIVAAVSRKLPRPSLLLGVAVAVVGLYLMLGESLTSFQRGEMLGLACSIAFSLHLLATSHTARAEGPWKMCGAQFLVAGIAALIPALWHQQLSPTALPSLLLDPQVLPRLAVLLAFPTLIAFGLMLVYQHQVDPTRATLIYQAESVLATAFDYLLTGRTVSPAELLGAGLILCANLLAELLPASHSERTAQTDPLATHPPPPSVTP